MLWILGFIAFMCWYTYMDLDPKRYEREMERHYQRTLKDPYWNREDKRP